MRCCAAGLVSIAMALFCIFLLPRTPPKKDVAHPLAFAKAFKLLAHPGFLILTIAAVPIAISHTGYFIRCSPYLKQDIGITDRWIQTVMGIGQISEVLFLMLVGLLLKRIGYRWMLVIGAFGYVSRFAIYAIGQPAWLVILAQGLHGVCFACFLATAYMYVERVASADIRHSAQTVFGMILGISSVLAAVYNAPFDRFTKWMTVGGKLAQVQSYTQFWWVQSGVALAAMIVLILLFRPHLRTEAEASAPA